MMMDNGNHNGTPSASGDSGRAPDGRFGPGNGYGRGNPHHRQVAALRSALLEAVTPADVKAIVLALIVQAKTGNVPAAKEVLDRVLGRVTDSGTEDRLAALEAALHGGTT